MRADRPFGVIHDARAAALSRIFGDSLDISSERAASIVCSLGLSPEERDRYLAILGHSIQRETTPLSEDKNFILSDWRYFAVLHFFDLDLADKSASAISARLAIGLVEVEKIIEKLVQHGLLARQEDGSLIKPEVHWAAGDGPPSELIRQFHRENLKLAAKALDLLPPVQRQFSAITFCGNPSSLEWARSEIMALVKKVSAKMEGARPREEVYRMSISLFPINFEENHP